LIVEQELIVEQASIGDRTDGGNVAITMVSGVTIPLCEPHLGGHEWKYVKECLDTGWVSTVGRFVTRFEQQTAARLGARHAVATVNGTSALHIALQLAGVGRDEEVLVSTLTFIAPANAIRYIGAWPVFIDAEPRTWQMDVQKVADFLARECRSTHGVLRNRHTGRRVRAIVPVHVLGHPVDMDPLLAIAAHYDLTVIEDATEALGAEYRGRPVGRPLGLGSHVACLSFNGNKLITTGGGGMLITDDESFAQRARYLTTQAKDDPVEYVHHEVGYNYRLTNVQAALGVAQLEQLDVHVEAKRRIARTYAAALEDVPGVDLMREASWARSAFWMYTVLVHPRVCGVTSRRLLNLLADVGIQTRPLWQPLHLSVAHRGAFAGDCTVAERLYRQAISLPCSVGLSSVEQAAVISALTRICHRQPPRVRRSRHGARPMATISCA
jgi:perosamine synthetase